MYDVISIGTATLDALLCCVNLYTTEVNGEQKVILPYGAKIELGEALFETGGGATNTATTFSYHGLKTAVVAKIGDDFPGHIVLENLKKTNIDTSHIVVMKGDLTDYSTIIWAPRVGNVIIVCRGKTRLEVTDVKWDLLESKWFYISSVEGNLEIPTKLEQLCKKKNANAPKIAWNPGKRELSQKNIVESLLPFVEIFMLNRLEAATFTQTDIQDITAILAAVQKLPSTMKIVTDGHNGSYFHNGTEWIWSEAFKVEKQEPTGAGDAYGSAFVTGLIKGFSQTDTLKFAAANAASAVMQPGAKQGILKKEEIDSWLQKDLAIRMF